MRVVTTVALVLAATLSLGLLLRCQGATLHVSVPEDDEDDLARPVHRDYGLLRRAIRNDDAFDDAFDDYGHLRFGRSYERHLRKTRTHDEWQKNRQIEWQ